MNNSHTNASPSPLQLLGLCPLLALGLTVNAALLLGLALLITSLITRVGLNILSPRWLTEPHRLIAALLIAATSVGIIDLFLQSFFYENVQTLQLFLPLTIVVILLFDTGTMPARLTHALLDSIKRNVILTLMLTLFALLRGLLPTEAGIPLSLIISSLLLAIAQWITHRNTPSTNPPPAAPRQRARVTGPVR